MLSIKKNPGTKAAKQLTFDKPTQIQKHGIEMLIALNTTDRNYITGPEVGLEWCILVTKAKPHFFFNPSYTVLNNPDDGSIIEIQYQNYLGNEKKLEVEDHDNEIRTAIEHLNNGRPRKKRAKKDAD